MPKIKSTEIFVKLGGRTERIALDIFFTERDGFYGRLPEKFDVELSNLNKNKALEPLFTFKRTGKYSLDYSVPRVNGTDIKTITDNAVKIMELILKADVVRRPIIMLLCEKSQSYSRVSSLNHDHQKIGIELGLKYCYEVKKGDAAPTYATMRKIEGFGAPATEDWQEFRPYDKDVTIIDDTPENREFVEDIYSKLKNLIEKLTEIGGNPTNLLEFIASQQKLLG